MKKSISVSNLTLDLYLDYVRPAAIAAGILEEGTTQDGLTIYTTDAAAADEIAHCMYIACMGAGADDIERTHEEYIRHEAERMIYQLTVSVQHDTTHTAEPLAPLLAAMTEALHPTTPAEAAQAAPAAPQADGMTAAMISAICAPTPAQTVTVTWANGTRATYSANMLDLLRTDPAALDIQDDTTGEMVYIKPDPAESATEIQKVPTTTNDHKEEVTPMSNTTERYDYIEHMTADVIDAIRERYTDEEIRARLDDDRDDLAQELNDDLWTDDSVTGNASGSYYCNAWRAEDAIAHNWGLIADMIDEFDAADILRKGPEAIDVSIRCYLLGQAIDTALDQLDDEIPEAADSIPA